MTDIGYLTVCSWVSDSTVVNIFFPVAEDLMTVLRANIAFAKSRFEFAISFQFNNFHAPVNFLNSLQGKENGIRGNGRL